MTLSFGYDSILWVVKLVGGVRVSSYMLFLMSLCWCVGVLLWNLVRIVLSMVIPNSYDQQDFRGSSTYLSRVSVMILCIQTFHMSENIGSCSCSYVRGNLLSWY